MIQRKCEWRAQENKAKVVGLIDKFLMKLKAEEIREQDNMTQVKLRLTKLQKEMQGLQKEWLEVCRSEKSVGD